MTTFELWPGSTNEDKQAIIRAVYRHVLGNPHVMDSERLVTAESQLCDGTLSVRDFVRAVGKSDFYRSRYFESCAPYRFVELNFMHFLGRAPESQAELSEHIRRCVEEGYDADIDSYIDSDEYQANFGENVVPSYNANVTQVGQSQVSYNRIFAIDRGPAQVSSAVKSAQLLSQVAGAEKGNKVKRAATNLNSGTTKRFKIKTTAAKFDAPRRVSMNEYIVSADKMTPQIQRIHRTGAKIVSITEIV
ncbi:phycobilisome rod-core linker polypeptide [Leptothoe spongobia]|uniref:Phycobilisome rod-core linker polypeptide n=1 Tax=Leptothoe spongobia TAU-MAC 1115 TaxID=1967444 RepID=A0A947DGS4_9CYAN|nr:phycobilisome rod-core linker polypeptide [Leptothoe spongobia]MBT9316792.1 phycobilisome rod-core linker polypeptide [Leptothoe spongobia TAU-MAC 1115]